MILPRPQDFIEKTRISEGERGGWKVERFSIDQEQADFENLRISIGGSARFVEPGTYTRLITPAGVTMMSDTRAEMRDHFAPVRRAISYPDKPALVAGLGIGMVAEALLRAGVPSVDVVEISRDVIDLVSGDLLAAWGDRLNIIERDIFEFTPEKPRTKRYGVAWFDVWPYICGDNVSDFTMLRRRWARWADWRGIWCEAESRAQHRQTVRWGTLASIGGPVDLARESASACDVL